MASSTKPTRLQCCISCWKMPMMMCLIHKDVFFIQDGNALFHALMDIPPTFGDICLKVLDQMMAKKNFVFSTDSYHIDCIKAQETLFHGSSQWFIIDGPATRMLSDFKIFLANEENKTQLCHLLWVWGSKEVWNSNCNHGGQGISDGLFRWECEYLEIFVMPIWAFLNRWSDQHHTILLQLVQWCILRDSTWDPWADLKPGRDKHPSCVLGQVCCQAGVKGMCGKDARQRHFLHHAAPC